MTSTLSVGETALLKPAMAALKIEGSFQSVALWGKLLGADADYIVVVAVEASEDYPTKRFYSWHVRRAPLPVMFVANVLAASGARRQQRCAPSR